MVRILFVVPCYYPAHRYGGPVKSTHELARALVTMGVDITVFTTNANGVDDLQVPLNVEVDIDGVKVWYFKAQRPRSYFRSTQFSRVLRARLKEFDLVHINWLYVYTTMVAARECLRQHIPYILSPRGMLDPYAIAMKGLVKKTLYLRWIESRHLAGAALVHFSSNGEFRQAESGGWRFRAAVGPLGLNVTPYAARPDTEPWLERFSVLRGKKQVLFLGRINYIKGLDLLAKAWPSVMSVVPNAHLVIAGPDDDDYAIKVKQWLAEGCVSQHVTFAGMLLGNEKLVAMHSADVCIMPSYLESFGMSIVEAMACSKPVVVTDRVNICDEIAAACAGLVVPCDSEKIAQGIVTLLRNPESAAIMGKNGYKLVQEKFTVEKAATRIFDIYKKILRIGQNEN